MEENQIREVYFYEEYFLTFYNSLDKKVKLKIDWTINVIETTEKIPVKYFKHLTGTNGLYEIRVEVFSNTYRIFSFFDKGKLIVLINGFQKKTQKTPRKEITKALKLKEKYFNEKEK